MNMRAFRYKLKPTAEQKELFRHFAGVCRLVYNLALEQRRDFHRQYERATGKRLSYVVQAAELTKLRAEVDWIGAVYVSCQQQALRDLDRAYLNFFAAVQAIQHHDARVCTRASDFPDVRLRQNA